MARAVSEFQSLLAGLAAELQGQVDRLVPRLSRLEKRDVLAFITDAFPELVTPFLAAAANLTTTWYDEQDPDSPFLATPADLAPVDRLAISGRWGMLQANPAAALGGAGSRALFDASRETVIKNADVEGVMWARQASETACGFCRMLATNGAMYSGHGVVFDEEAGDYITVVVGQRRKGGGRALRGTRKFGEKYHDNCQCIAVPVRGGVYEPPEYVAQWKRDYHAARTAGAKTAGEIANAMDYAPGGRRYKGDDAPPHEVRHRPVNLDEPRTEPKPRPVEPVEPSETEAAKAARLLPGFEKSLEDLRAQGLPEDSPQIQYHIAMIAKLRRQLKVSA